MHLAGCGPSAHVRIGLFASSLCSLRLVCSDHMSFGSQAEAYPEGYAEPEKLPVEVASRRAFLVPCGRPSVRPLHGGPEGPAGCVERTEFHFGTERREKVLW